MISVIATFFKDKKSAEKFLRGKKGDYILIQGRSGYLAVHKKQSKVAK